MNFINEKSIGAMYQKRLITDVLFEAEVGSWNYTGEYDRAARFVEEHQVMNPALWTTFVEQFRVQLDAEDGGWRGEYYGKMMRGACWIYKYTKNEKLYRTLDATVRYLLSCQEENGRISSYKQDGEFGYWDMWCRKYVMLGSQYFYEICKDEEFKAEIITKLNRHLDYIIDHIGEGEGQIDILDSTTHNPWTWGALNSSSILEPVVRQYWLTGEKKYLDFASYIVKRGGSKWGNIYKLAIEGKKAPYEYPVTKAYEATSFFEGVLEYYRATGDEDAKAAYINFMAKVVETDLTVIGCSGCTHELFDHSSLVQTEVNDEVKQETCVTVTLMKAFYQALCLTGEAKYAEAMERSGYNAMLGAVNFNKLYSAPNDKGSLSDREFVATAPFVRLIEGFTFDSYSPLYKDKRARRIGGFKVMPGGTSYGCCACIGASGIAVMPISSVMLSKNGLTVNHYMNGTFTAGGVTLDMETKYPYGEKISIKVHTGAPVSFALSLRIPSETVGRATIDGKAAKVNELGYAVIEREWCEGDTVELVIPRDLKTMRLNGKVAVSYGTIMLALDERNQDIDVKVTDKITKIEPMVTNFASREAYKVTFSNETTVNMVDYASAGAEWNKPDCRVTVWIDEE